MTKPDGPPPSEPPSRNESHTEILTEALRLLIIDDKKFARNMTERVLRSLGYTDIIDASGGTEGVDAIQQADPPIDIVICDLMMPDMDGIQVVREVANLENPPAFIFASGAQEKVRAATEELASARGLSVLGAIEKPVTPDGLKPLLAAHRRQEEQATRNPLPSLTVKEIASGLDGDTLCLFYQPKVNLATRHIDGVEALVRWQHPDHGILPPAAFIETAEESGLIGKITQKVIDLALTQSAAWHAQGINLRMSINVSARDLDDVTLPDQIAQNVSDHGVAPEKVVIEVTESGVLQDLATSLDILTRLHMKGIVLSIDDFGTGYSSMEQLERIPFSELKIDRAFVTNAQERPKAMAILQASVDLAQRMGLHTIAEGAESQDDWDVLAETGVDLVQGYFVARPMPPEEVPAWIKNWT